MTKPFKLECHCGFTTEDPQALTDHMLTNPDHFGDLKPEPETGDVADLSQLFGMVQAFAAGGELPEGAEVTPMSEQDILDDEELSDEDKQAILGRVAQIEAGRQAKTTPWVDGEERLVWTITNPDRPYRFDVSLIGGQPRGLVRVYREPAHVLLREEPIDLETICVFASENDAHIEAFLERLIADVEAQQ